MTLPVRWESILCFSTHPFSPTISLTLYPLPCTPPLPPVLPSQQLSADCLGFLVPIRPIALCFHQTQHLSYHCLDNCLLVQKSLQALCSHGDDMVTLPGSSEPPAEKVDPFPLLLSSSHPALPSAFLFAHPLCSSFGSSPHPWSLQLFKGGGCPRVCKRARLCMTDEKFSCSVCICQSVCVVILSPKKGGQRLQKCLTNTW